MAVKRQLLIVNDYKKLLSFLVQAYLVSLMQQLDCNLEFNPVLLLLQNSRNEFS